MNKGFTLVEILITVLIMGVLVTMAVPMYERTIEKSRIAQVRVELKRIYDAKRRVLDNLESEFYNPSDFGFENLDYTPVCQNERPQTGHMTECQMDDFTFFIEPRAYQPQAMIRNYVCAVRRTGDYMGVNFLYKGDEVSGEADKFFCNDGSVHDGCEVYGMDTSGSSAYCRL